MIQPATLRLESNGGQENTVYFKSRPLRLVLMLQLLLLKSKCGIQVLEVHKLALFSQN